MAEGCVLLFLLVQNKKNLAYFTKKYSVETATVIQKQETIGNKVLPVRSFPVWFTFYI